MYIDLNSHACMHQFLSHVMFDVSHFHLTHITYEVWFNSYIGVEYIVSDRIFDTLPLDEQRLWHSHAYEVCSPAFWIWFWFMFMGNSSCNK